MGGRLGNQLFQYASARALQEKFYPSYTIKANFYYFQNLSESQKSDKGWENSLRFFRIRNVEYISEPPGKTKKLFQRALTFGRRQIMKIFPSVAWRFVDNNLLQPIYNLCGIYRSPYCTILTGPLPSFSRNIFCECSFSWNLRDFDSIREFLLEDFTPLYDILPHNQQLMSDIQGSESVCVTIRRGDFLAPEHEARHNVCNEEYFVTAMKAIREEIPGCKFFVFSDDVDDVKRNMHFPFDVTYERGNDPVWEKLRLMYSCRHFIISNSTFSWWAQYLSRNPSKIVYAPVPWHWQGEKWEGLYLPYMRTIRCHR